VILSPITPHDFCNSLDKASARLALRATTATLEARVFEQPGDEPRPAASKTPRAVLVHRRIAIAAISVGLRY
jgi:hypothetical protein